jgi:hypothetical protein
MNCEHARELLPALIYGDLSPETKIAVDNHLATCPRCREEQAALAEVRRLLDAAPLPKVQVEVPRLLEDANRLRQDHMRRWRRAAGALGGLAAALLFILCLKFEVRWQGQQVVFRWGTPAAELEHALSEERPPVSHPAPEVTAADMKLVRDLLHALAAAVEERDGRFQQNLAQLERQLSQMQEQAGSRWRATESYVSALHTAQIEARTKGEK